MKIVHISHLYYPSSGGVQTYFKNISERLVKDYNDDVTVVTTNSFYGPEKTIYKKIDPAWEIINGVKVIRFSYRRWHIKPYRFFSRLCRFFKIKVPEEIILQRHGPFSPTMKSYLLNAGADVFFASSSNYYFMQLPLWRSCNFFYFGSIHLDQEEKNDHLLKRQLESINASTLYIANTDFEKQRMIRLGADPDKIAVLGCGVDMAPFVNTDRSETEDFKLRNGIPSGAVVIGYVGRIEITKNVQLLIHAFEKMQALFAEAFLLIAGTESEYAGELINYCSSLPAEINNRIKWLTGFPSSDKPALFNSIDILVLPSRNESFGIVFLEAWSCKKPVIGASIGAVKDVIKDGHDGLIAIVDNADSLAEKMKILLSDPQMRWQMGENGFKKVQENYTWDIIVSRLRKYYINSIENSNNKIAN